MRGVVRRGSAIFEAAWAKPELRGMGTTLTAALVHGGRAHLVHAGDSRCYMFRDGQLRQLTEDHSWIAEQLRSGQISEAEAKSSKFRHVITKSIGFEREIEADMKSVPVSAGDCFLLCSDGMSNYIEHGELERIVAMTWYRRLPETLIELANNRGGDDNITVVVGLVANVGTAPASLSQFATRAGGDGRRCDDVHHDLALSLPGVHERFAVPGVLPTSTKPLDGA
jgi:protein phosphatase